MRVNDAVSGLVVAGFGTAVIAVASGFRDMPGQAFGPKLMPSLIGAILIACGLSLILRGWRERENQPIIRVMGWMREPRSIANLMSVLAALVFYILFSDILGFFITSFLILASMMLWLRGRSHALTSLAISLAAVILVQLFFGRALLVPLPHGVLAPLLQ